MYKILYLTQFAEIGGGETILLSLLSKLNRRQFDPTVVLPQEGQLSKKLRELKIHPYYLPLNPYLARTFFVPGASPSQVLRLIRLTQKIKPALIHINHLTLAVYSGVCSKIFKIPVVATAHGPWDSLYFYQDIITQLFVDKILANTPQTAKSLLKQGIIKRQKVEVVPFGIDTRFFAPAKQGTQNDKRRMGLAPGDLVITIVGRLDPAKDHLTFLKAANLVQKKIKNVTFFIAGSKKGDFSSTKNQYLQKLHHFLKENPSLAQKVVFGGFIDQMEKVYQVTDVLVSTSLSESFGLALAEGAACSLPIVATNSGGSKFIVKDGQNGFLVAPKSPNLMAKAILKLAKNPTLRSKFGQFGKNHIVKNYSIENYVLKIQSIYLKLLGRSFA